MKIKKLILIVLAVMLIPVVQGCSKPKSEGTVIAVIGDEEITDVQFNERIENLPERYRKVIEQRKEDFLEEIINDNLVYQKAMSEGVDKDEELIKMLAEARRKIIIAKYLQDTIEKKINVTEDDIKNEYETNKTLYVYPEAMRVSHVLVKTENEANEVLAEIKAGGDFAVIAKENSVDPTAQAGGDIGYFPKGQLLPEFEAACAELEPGEISEVVRTKIGYHVIKLTDRKPPKQIELKDIANKIVQKLQVEKKKAMFGEMITKLRKEINVKINKDALNKSDVKTEK